MISEIDLPNGEKKERQKSDINRHKSFDIHPSQEEKDKS